MEAPNKSYHGQENNDKQVTEYQYTLYSAVKIVSGYEEAVEALIELKYSHGDEISLMRKGMANHDDAEYVSYIEYVGLCKECAREYFRLNK